MKYSIKEKNNFTNIINIALLLAFILVGFLSGANHEPWADEAQGWLIARDVPLSDIFRISSYEGTQPLWYIVIKLFQLFNLKYEYFFVISLTATALGAAILLFRIDISITSKILILFSFVTIYQCISVARSYSLVFPFLMMIAASYKDRTEKPLMFFAGVFLLSLTSSYGTIMAGSFLLICLAESIYAFRKKQKEKTKFTFEFIACCILIGLLTLLIIPDRKDLAFWPGRSTLTFSQRVVMCFLFNTPQKVLAAILAFALIAFFVYYMMQSKSLVNAFIITFPVAFYIRFFAGNNWHLTNLYFLVIAELIIFKPDFNKLKKSALYFIKTFIVLVMCTQVLLAGYNIYQDYKGEYSGSKKAAEFIDEYVENGNTIYDASNYYATALQPYFDENIYINHPTKDGYYFWSMSNGYFESNDLDEIATKYGTEPTIIVDHPINQNSFKGYEKHVFEGNMYYKNTAANDSEIIVWVKK